MEPLGTLYVRSVEINTERQKKASAYSYAEALILRYNVGSENLIILLQLCTSYRELCAILNNDNAVVLDNLTVL